MKIIDNTEVEEHKSAVLSEGLKGCAVGLGVAFTAVQVIKRRYPVGYKQMNASVRAALWAMPTICLGAFFADDGSVKFDENRYRHQYFASQKAEIEAELSELTTKEKYLHKLNEHKFEVIVSSWAAAMYGSWRYVSRDKLMPTTQKLVQARVYAQAITVLLLLGTIVLSVQDSKAAAKLPKPIPEWKRILNEKQERQEKIAAGEVQ